MEGSFLGVVYIITNTRNDKVYVGITRVGIKKRWTEHVKASAKAKTRFGKAIKEIGYDKFRIQELEEFRNEEDLLKAEYEYIKKYDSCNPDKGYNTLHFSNSKVESVNLYKAETEAIYLAAFIQFGVKNKDVDLISLFNSGLAWCRDNREVVISRLKKAKTSSICKVMEIRKICQNLDMTREVFGDDRRVYRRKDGSVHFVPNYDSPIYGEYLAQRRKGLFRGRSIGG